MYEDKTPETIKTEILASMGTALDIREGSYTNDMVAAVALQIWKLYNSLNALIPMVYVDDTSGTYIDSKCANYGITRKNGTKATVTLSFTGTNGTEIAAGSTFLTINGLQFRTTAATMIANGIASVAAEAVTVGELYNVAAASITRQMVTKAGINTVTNAATTAGGTNAETDATLVTRLYAYLQKPATSGNVNHYEQWALAVNGVGAAKVTALENGAGSVGILIGGADKGPVDSSVVTACSAHIEDMRPIGAAVTVTSVSARTINVTATITIDASTTKAVVQAAFTAQLTAYLAGLAMVKYTIVYNRVAFILMDLPGVENYSVLTINSVTTDIVIAENEIPLLGTVVVS